MECKSNQCQGGRLKIEFKVGGKELAKVLIYYGLISDASQDEYKIICPFHGDINPSMKVNLVEGTFYCFGCTVSGNALKFVKLANPKMDDLQALKEYMKILKSKKVCNIDFAERKRKPRIEDKQYLLEAEDYYYGLKTINWKTDDQQETIECLKYMEDRGFNASILNKAKAKVTYNASYPIIFPMLDNGVFRGWVCRTNNSEVAKKRKYLYNKGFSRATTLVGNYENTKIVVIVEGYMDYLKMRMFGMHKVVAILGWKITDEQIKKLKDKGIETVISALDNDECGIKGTKYLRKFFKVVRWQYDKSCKDAGDMNEKSFRRMKNKTKLQLIDTN